jgi:hypothetical protein
VLQRLERFEFSARIEDGLLILEDSPEQEPAMWEAMAVEITKYLPEIRRILEQKACIEHARLFLERRVWSAENGEAVLRNVADGRLVVHAHLGFSENPSLITADPAGLVIFAPYVAKQTPSHPEAANAGAPGSGEAPKSTTRKLRELLDSFSGKEK